MKRLLIANRGEIAVRIIRTADRLGIETVLVVSEADKGSLAAEMADEVVLIGPAPPAESYLRIDRILEAARRTRAEAVHPGYGLLAENADFASAVRAAGLAFVGPTAEAMRALGGKAAAKAIAARLGVPVIPGTAGPEQDLGTLAAEAARIGYPLLIKATAGGGGRGMRVLEREADLAPALESARREAKAAFGDDAVMLEKLIPDPRHVEVQIFGDAEGNLVHLYDRDCSLQRRHQKVVEEAPAPGLDERLRGELAAAAVRLAKAVAYQGAGTVEFLIEGGGADGEPRWYFIEANTRLQVEHTVTEMVTGLDLVEWQLRIAAGERLPLAQGQISCSGHAVETRLCAEDPAHDFAPSTGRLAAFAMPVGPGIRVDTGVRASDEVAPYYDSLIAKIVSHGENRHVAMARQLAALDALHLAGPRTNAAFLHALLSDPDVTAGRMSTSLIARSLKRLTERPDNAVAVAQGLRHMLESAARHIETERLWNGGEAFDPWRAVDGFQLGGERRQFVTILVDGAPTTHAVRWTADGPVVCPRQGNSGTVPRHVRIADDGDRVFVQHDLWQTELRWPAHGAEKEAPGKAAGAVRAPINGRIAEVYVAEGGPVEKGQRIAVIEAMKMEHVLVAPLSGRLARLAVTAGEQVAQGSLIATIVTEGSPA
ncbi:MAG TPA: biotin carboxylase N-terminal domain-containing protein [Hyphomicrobiaceae bacterium]|nr:biotin carboxylase N-terminal domain-containing protein [Hyphomicrobiaceae bacterium]